MNPARSTLQRNESVPYGQDFYGWTRHTATLLRQGRLNELDRQHLAEEVESMGNAQKHALISHLAVRLMHLLKWRHQPNRRTASWQTTILVQRDEVAALLEDSPSLGHELPQRLERAYRRARIMAASETGLALNVFPPERPLALEQVMTPDWLPADDASEAILSQTG